ncbi:hypothetical protein [Streptomyces sp. NBC_01207]|uniref:hypothetical protein n=1 Tax=Streptomyces sp. NBC_01207 TaxID=2903772 RepID=UPI002E118D3D|nr:hypothetical protein OG457_31180 [Streptomyces sp. NBC_01207]
MPQDPSTSGPDEPKGDQGPEVNEHQDQRKGTEPEGEQPAKGTEPEELTAERTAREAAEKRATEAEAEASRLRRSNAAQKPGDLDALREEIRSEFAAQLVRAEVRAAAAGRLRDPADALALVDVAALTSKGGEVDVKAVTAAVEQLVTDKPYLAAPDQNRPAPMWGDVGAGQRESGEPEPATPHDRLRRAYTAD